LSTGDIFRYNKKRNQTRKLAQTYMDQGDLVPDDVTIKMLQAEVDNNRFSRILFDGFQEHFRQRP
jgi:adenylate kinase